MIKPDKNADIELQKLRWSRKNISGKGMDVIIFSPSLSTGRHRPGGVVAMLAVT